RKLYWADRLGMLIMADVPNSWGEPDSAMRREAASTLQGMVARDYNHPAIFAWVLFNETWGLFTKAGGKEVYRPETQGWVASLYRATKALDPTRLVEDNSPCCGRGHTETDLNSWHSYLPGWAWEEHDRVVSDSTYPGAQWNVEAGYRQARQPDINSQTAPAGAELRVPLYASFLTSGKAWGDSLTLSAQLYGWDALGRRRSYLETTRRVPFHPWMTGPLEPLPITVPAGPAVLVLAVRLEDGAGTVLHRNFCTFVVEGEPPTEVRLD